MEFTKSSSPSSRQRFCHIRKCGHPVTTITTHCRPRGSRLPRRAGSSKYYAAPDCSCRAVAELHRRAFLLSEVNTAWEAHIVTSKLKASSVCTRAQSLGRQRRPKLNGSPRMLIYPHDISGLGHPRRTIAPAKAFVEVVISGGRRPPRRARLRASCPASFAQAVPIRVEDPECFGTRGPIPNGLSAA